MKSVNTDIHLIRRTAYRAIDSTVDYGSHLHIMSGVYSKIYWVIDSPIQLTVAAAVFKKIVLEK